MNPSVKLHLIETEMTRWLTDVRPQPERDRVHADRVASILVLGGTDTRTAVPS